ncbi:hypothetical protein GPALN_012940 [Globodera pallida]|nr:hypothetical protein GPALN_012940 [Globodera pallida]
MDDRTALCGGFVPLIDGYECQKLLPQGEISSVPLRPPKAQANELTNGRRKSGEWTATIDLFFLFLFLTHFFPSLLSTLYVFFLCWFCQDENWWMIVILGEVMIS